MVRAWLFPVALVGLAWGVLGLALVVVSLRGASDAKGGAKDGAASAAELGGRRRALISAGLLTAIALVSAGLAVSTWP